MTCICYNVQDSNDSINPLCGETEVEMDDKNGKSVESKIKSIRGMELFKNCDEDSDYHIINDFSRACEMAFDEFNYIYEGEEGHSWNDIREKEYDDVYQSVYDREDYLTVSDMLEELELDVIDSIELTREAEEVIDEIEADLKMCLETTAIAGDNNVLFKNMFEAYTKGGWPCGWEGSYPEGRLIVYFPKS